MFDLFDLFDTSDFPARWTCGNWSAPHGWMHIVSDVLIWGAYMTIPLVLAYFVARRKDLPFPAIFWLFCAFIFACGTTHLIDAMLFWWPAYRVSGIAKATTALVSWATVIALVPIMPKALSLPGLEKVNTELRLEVAQRTKAQRTAAAQAQQLRRANEEMDGLFAIVRHDLGQPVVGVRNLLQVLREQIASGKSPQLDYVDLCINECSHMQQMLSDLSAYNHLRSAPARLNDFELRKMVDTTVQMYRKQIEQAGVRVVVTVPETRIRTDETLLHKALGNLIENAVKYGCPEPGCTIELTGHIEDDYLTLSVRDHGSGIPADVQDQVFELFVRLDPTSDKPGTGIGLASVKQIAQRLGGSITLQSSPGQGATFTLRLPLAQSAMVEANGLV